MMIIRPPQSCLSGFYLTQRAAETLHVLDRNADNIVSADCKYIKLIYPLMKKHSGGHLQDAPTSNYMANCMIKNSIALKFLTFTHFDSVLSKLLKSRCLKIRTTRTGNCPSAGPND